MNCNKCNQRIPIDSEFCQYCGNRIEKTNVNDTIINESLDTIIKLQSQETVKAIKENEYDQPNNEIDSDFGLVAEKPIFTYALKSVDGEENYLNKLLTTNGEKIKYHRHGSTTVPGIHGIIDIYDTFLPSGKFYKTLYINMYGAKDSHKAPAGFVFSRQKAVFYNINSGKTPTSTPKNQAKLNNKLISFANISTLLLTIISLISIIIAMNVQDDRRNYLEHWHTTTVYCVLLLILGLLLILSIWETKQKTFKFTACLSPLPVIALIIVQIEGSIFSYNYFEYHNSYSSFEHYINSDTLSVFNGIMSMCIILIFTISLIPIAAIIINKSKAKWHSSIAYREKCYQRVDKMYSYLEKGIITQEEFEKTKNDVLKHIQSQQE